MVKNDEEIKGGKFTGSAPAPGATVTMEVPMKGLQGELVMATIRLPRRLVAGAAGRPVLLTITPKAGGGRQAVLLTPNHRRAKGEDKDPGKGDSKAALLREDRETPKAKETKSCSEKTSDDQMLSNNEKISNEANDGSDDQDEDSNWVRKYFEKTPGKKRKEVPGKVSQLQAEAASVCGKAVGLMVAGDRRAEARARANNRAREARRARAGLK